MTAVANGGGKRPTELTLLTSIVFYYYLLLIFIIIRSMRSMLHNYKETMYHSQDGTKDNKNLLSPNQTPVSRVLPSADKKEEIRILTRRKCTRIMLSASKV